ncbi:hypothetical protein AJ80_04472 [Polytolypa hystricis UAMH7299]|uniref:Uncharacterized protein n=1 Tax=Polytolypa hystricis (strain UAMH7299) TaxID=1447883 RepID=A0A2B7YCA8_POLH7|nr:hypothetical protein AJ80_04472 [Polytolypa hystricis UAMH7299]
MQDKPSDSDIALLERLNALKPSTVQLEHRTVSLELSDAEDDEDTSLVTDLTARFTRLGASATGGHAGLRPDSLSPAVQSREAIEGLLGSFPERSSHSGFNNDDDDDVERVVGDAKRFLNSSSRANNTLAVDASDHNPQWRQPSQSSHLLPQLSEEQFQDGPSDEELEEDADECLERILEELAAEEKMKKEPDPQPPPATSPPHTSDVNLKNEALSDKSGNGESNTDIYGSQPRSPPPSQTDETTHPSISNDMLALPSVPDFAPTEKSDASTGRHRWEGEDRMPSWCCICSDDADVRCLDCVDELLYCYRCWREAHLEEGDIEEKRHVCVRFRKL